MDLENDSTDSSVFATTSRPRNGFQICSPSLCFSVPFAVINISITPSFFFFIFSRTDFRQIFFGANDAVLPVLPQDLSIQHVPVDEYSLNLEKLVLYLRNELKIPRIIVIGPPPVDGQAFVVSSSAFCDS
jgi:hypothetical protein